MTDAPPSDPNVIHLPSNGSGADENEGASKSEKKDPMNVD